MLPLPDSLAQEGRLMLQTLVGELTGLRNIELLLTHDNRLEAPATNSRAIDAGEDVWQIWRKCLDECAYFWPIAPETNGALYRLTELAQETACEALGSTAAAVHQCSSKLHFAGALADRSIPGITTGWLIDGVPSSETGWIVKPDVGAGCEQCYHFYTRQQVEKFSQTCENPSAYIVQPYVPGIAASLSILIYNDEFSILACNRQNIEEKDHRLRLAGLEINAFAKEREIYYPMVRQIVKTVGGLNGFVGIDMIITAKETRIVEINPRITTAFFGLSRSLGRSISGIMLDMFAGRALPVIPSGARPIRIGLSDQ